MKRIFIAAAFILFAAFLHAQNVGIDVPVPQQKLDVNGAIKIGTTATNQPGAIRFNAGKFEGGDGTNWKSLEGTTSGIVGTKLYNNPALLNAGYSLFGEIQGISRYSTVNTTFLANTWQPTYIRGIITNVAAPPNPQGAAPALAVWSGSLMYVAAGNMLYAYNPVTDIWNLASNQGVPLFHGIKAVWTGSEIIFWGDGFVGSRYNPATNIWTALPVTNAPSQRGGHTMIWDGTRVIIWGGHDGVFVNTGAMYNPATNTWTTMSISGAPTARYATTAIWNNAAGRMIIWGGSNDVNIFPGLLNTGGIFDPLSNSWTGTTNTVGAPSARIDHSAIWTGTEMIIFGGTVSSVTSLNTGSRYNPSTNSWTAINTIGAPVTGEHSAIWTGTGMFVTGGKSGYALTSLSRANSYNPATDLWTSILDFSAQEGKDSHHSFLAGNMILIWGGQNMADISQGIPFDTNTGYRYFLTNTASSATTLTSETLYLYQKN